MLFPQFYSFLLACSFQFCFGCALPSTYFVYCLPGYPGLSIFHRVSIQFNISFKYSKWLNISIWPINGALTGTTTLDLSGPGSNDNVEVLHIPQSSRTGGAPSDVLVSYPRHAMGEGILPFCRDSVSVFYSPSRPGCRVLRPIWVSCMSQIEIIYNT